MQPESDAVPGGEQRRTLLTETGFRHVAVLPGAWQLVIAYTPSE